jgi:hypothetical protein
VVKRRDGVAFSLSFLDVMSCGFGAVILIYIIINHATEVTSQEVNLQLMAEIKKYETQVEDETAHLVELRNTVDESEDEIVTTESLASKLIETIKQLELELAELAQDGASQDESIEDLKSELKELELEAANLEGSVAADDTDGTDLRSVVGQGDRQYLTGMKVGGDNILILMDASASMLDRKIINVYRRRILPEEQQKQSPKWQRAIRTVEWVLANLPKDADFQLFTFNAETKPALKDSGQEWLSANDRTETDGVVKGIKDMVPKDGTSLYFAFDQIRKMRPEPDNIFLIVDSLPTLGSRPPRGSNISSRDRVELFSESIDLIPAGIPVNIILFPMEGDPLSTASYWKLAQITGGSFLAPSDDWP